MARIFTTTFEFNNQAHDAIVTVSTHKDQVTFTIRILNADLYDFLPEGEISFAGADGFEQIKALDNTISQSLMRKLGDAIKMHLQTV